MPPERWRQIEAIFNAALERDPVVRPAFLENACGGDEALRRQVEALLQQDAQAGELLSQPIEKVADEVLSDDSLTPGSMAGPYRIGERIGAGGMGEVYRAQDTRLDRTVAIKTLKARFTERFEREARAISALNHPHICTLYDIGPNYLVMEYVEGAPLKGPLPVAEALRLAIQIASALEAAHAKGILHRDLKPGNILVSKGEVKLLDFGLAKFMATEPRQAEETITAPLTGTGEILGTLAYMAPEQIEGKPADARSDIFSFGLVLYEMLAGRRAFEAASKTGLMAAILKEEPPPLTAIPPALDRTVRKCLAKDPARRWQTAADLRDELERIGQGESAISQRWKVMVPAAAALALVAAGYSYLRSAPLLTDRDTIVLADFINKTDDPVFDGTLRQGLAVQLEQSPFLSLVSDERIQQVLGLMGQPADAPLTPQVAKEICQRAASAAVLEGSITPLGSRFVLGLRATNCRTGAVLDEQQGQAGKKEDVLNVLSQIARKFRTRVGESLAQVKQHDTPLPEVTTRSLEALKVYSTAWKVWRSTGPAASLPHIQRAIDLDPQFALAHAFLGRVYGELWEPVKGAESANKAYELRGRVSDPERFSIMLFHDLDVTGNLEKAEQTAESWAETYPRDATPRGLLSWIDQQLGKYEKSVEDSKKAVVLDPSFPPAYANLAWTYVQLDRPTDAEKALRLASDHKVAFPEFLVVRYYIAYLRGDQAGMKREAAQSEENADVGDWILNAEACVLAYSGHLQEARRKSRQAVNSAKRAAHKLERAAMWEAGAAVREAFFGNSREARQHAAAALNVSKGRDAEYGAALALALIGDTAQSQALARDLEKASEDTFDRFNYLPTLRALWALSRGDSSGAIKMLQIAAPYELGIGGNATGLYGIMYPVYVRGQAYLLAHRYAEAAGEFQKIRAYPGVVFTDPVGAMARWQLARALVLSGDSIKAKTAYQDFLTLWKDADQDIPILKQAKAEYAKLP